MAVTLASFRASFPEFDLAPDAVVLAKLAQAETSTPADTWGPWHDEGVEMLTASLLLISPAARRLAPDAKGATMSPYERRRAFLEAIVGGLNRPEAL